MGNLCGVVKLNLPFLLISLGWLFVGVSHGVPEGAIERLSADEFAEREVAQAEVFAWAVKGGEGAVGELISIWEEDEDPETTERIHRVLRALSDEEYQAGGSSYLGVSMTEQPSEPNEKGEVRMMIRVSEILRGSPADSSEIEQGDAIVSLNGRGWVKKGAIGDFSKTIEMMKPGSVVRLGIIRPGEGELEVQVTLRRRPVRDLAQGFGNFGEMEGEAMDEHFEVWMAEKRKLAK